MNIVETVDADSQLQEKETKEICTNGKENIEKDNIQIKETINNKQNEDNSSSDDTEKCIIQNNDNKMGNDIQDRTNGKNSNSQNDQPELKNSEVNGSCEESEDNTDISKGNSEGKITIVLNSQKGYEIKNNKNNDTIDDNYLNHEKDDSIDEETTEDSISDKSEDEEKNHENKENGVKSSENEENVDGEVEGGENEESEQDVDEDNTDGENTTEKNGGSEEEENDEKEEKEDVEEEKVSSKNMVNGGENVVNGIGGSKDEDDEDDDQDEENGDGDSKNDENDEQEIIDGCEETPEFDNKYEGKTSQLPNFAVVYSFLNMFGALMDLPNISLLDLEQSIDSTKDFGGKGDEPSILEMLHVKLFRKLSKSPRISGMANCNLERLNKIILKFCQVMNLDFVWDLQQHGYHILTSDQRLKILKHLCEVQFDENPKFRNDFSELYKADQSVLRLSPFGYEQDGSSVWLHEDTECNIHVYSVEDDAADGDTWRVRVGCLDDMSSYISKLKLQTEVNPKDIATIKIKERHIVREEERQRKKAERDLRRQEAEEKRAKKKGRSTRRGRGKKKEEDPPSPVPIISETSEEEEDDGCAHCYENKQTDIVLLCDGCDAAYHTLCLRPPVIDIPDDDWFCPFCLQVQLVQKLELKYIEIKNKLKKKERKAKRLDFYGIRSDNIVEQPTDGRRLGRAAARRVDYNFTDYDQLISEAVSNYKQAPVQAIGLGRREVEEIGIDENGTNDGDLEKTTKARRIQHTASIQKRKLNTLSSDDYEESEGSEYVYSSCEEVKYNNMKNFIVNDNIDEIEERYSRNKRLHRSGRSNRSNLRSSRRKRKKYEDDSDYGDSDKSSDDGQPQRRLRERKTQNLRNLYMYSEQFSDDDEEVVVKEVDDGGEWANDNEEGEEEVAEELESEEASSNAESEPEKRPPPPPPRKLRTRVKRKRYVVSDDDSDVEVPCVDDSEEEEKNNNKNKRIEIEDDSEEEEEEEEEEAEEEEEVEENVIESDNDENDNAEIIEDDEEMERKTQNELNNGGHTEGNNCEKETDKVYTTDNYENEKSIGPTESFDDEPDKFLREIKEEEKIAGINLKDENILKSGILPPCFSSSLPTDDTPSPFSDSPPHSPNDTPPETNIFRSSRTECSTFNSTEFWNELNIDNKKEKDTVEIERKPDIPQNSLSGGIDETRIINTTAGDKLSDLDARDDKLPKNIAVKDILNNEKVVNTNFRDISSYRREHVASTSSNLFIDNLKIMHSSFCSGDNSTVTSTDPVSKISTSNVSHTTRAFNDNSQDTFNEPTLDTVGTTFHKPLPSNDTSDSMTCDVKPKISEMESSLRMPATSDVMPKISDMGSSLRMPGAPSPFYSRPPPPYHPLNYSPHVPSRMPTPPASHRGPLHPQYRLRAMAAALQTRGPSPPFGVRQSQPVPVTPSRHQLSSGHRHQHSLPPGTNHMPSALRGPRQLQTSLGPRHPPASDHGQTHSPPVSTRPLHPIQHESGHRPPHPTHEAGHRPPHPTQHEAGHRPPHPTQHESGHRPPHPTHESGHRPPHPTHESSHRPPHETQHDSGQHGTPPHSKQSPIESRHPQPSIRPGTVNHPSVRPPIPSHSSSNPSLPTHPSMRLPTHPSARLRAPVAVSSAHQQTPSPMRPTPNYPYATNQSAMRAHPPNWPGSRAPYDYYQQFQRPKGAPSSTFYGGQPNWPRNQPPRNQPPPDWDRLQQKGDQNPGGNGNTQDPSSQKSQSKEFKEHMKQLKEQAKQEKELAKQEKEMKKLQKMREKELKKQNKRPYSPQTTPSNTPVGNMAYFKNMVIGGDSSSGGEGSPSTGSPYPPFKASRM